MGWNPFKSVGKFFKKAAAPLSIVNPGLGISSGFLGDTFDPSDPATEAQLDINDQNLALQREMNQQNQANWEKQFAYNEQLNNRNQSNWQAQFDFNKSVDQRNFEYTATQNALTRKREDTAIQRQVADAKAAGLSPLAVAGSGGSSSSVVSAPSSLSAPSSPGGVSAPFAPEMRAPVLAAPTFQNDLQMQMALLNFASQAFLQDRSLSSNEKVVKMQTSTQKFIAVSQLENAKAIADASNSKDLQIATNQLIELNRSNTAKEYQAKLDYFQKTVSGITGGHGRFSYGEHDVDTCRRHNEEISTRWAEFVKTLPADSLSKSQSDSTSVSGGLDVLKFGANGSYSKGKSDADSVGQSSSVQALIKSFWLRNENVIWIPKGGNF